MTEYEVLADVKAAIGITGEFQDSTLRVHIAEVKEYLKDAGVSADILKTEAAAGIIARGVSDLWDYGSGTGSLSPYFKERAIQLALKEKDDE